MHRELLALAVAGAILVGTGVAANTVDTVISARVGNGYQRAPAKDGTYEPEYYALSNGGRIFGTAADITVDRIKYPQVAEIAMKLLARQNYHYARSKEEARLLVVLQWGNTIAARGTDYGLTMNEASMAYRNLRNFLGPQGMGSITRGWSAGPGANLDGSSALADGGRDPRFPEDFESAMLRLFMENEIRDRINELNARVLGYMDELAESNDIRRWAGGGDRYNDLIADVEEARYYIVISAYDFPELLRGGQRKLLWQVRVSVRSPGNSFDDSVAAMLKAASKYAGQDSRRLIRGEETKGDVELGDIKFLGEAVVEEPAPGKKGSKR